MEPHTKALVQSLLRAGFAVMGSAAADTCPCSTAADALPDMAFFTACGWGASRTCHPPQVAPATNWAPTFPSVRVGWPATLAQMNDISSHRASHVAYPAWVRACPTFGSSCGRGKTETAIRRPFNRQ